MRKCDICELAIADDETYFDVVIWEMQDGEGVEVGEITMCQSCKEDKVTA